MATRSHPRRVLALAAMFVLLLGACTGRPSASAFANYEAMLVSEGKLRTDRAPADAPFGAADLVRDFEMVALRHEADSTLPGSPDNSLPNPLQRWEGPIRYTIGGSAATAADRAEIARLMKRISRLTGVDIARSDDAGANFLILITTPEERDHVSADLALSSPAFAETFDFWRRTPEVICVADNLLSGRHASVITAGLVVIGSETGPLLRRACIHEEVTQAMGLANDSPTARPSIFNDDGEFALLTVHDEYLLRILYDPRLRPGMSAEEAMPIVRRIVAGYHLPAPSERRATARVAGVTAGGTAPVAVGK